MNYWILFIFPATALASVCSNIYSCSECNSAVDSDGDKICEWCLNSGTCVPAIGLECVFGDRVSDKRECPIKILPGFEYNDTLARKILLPLSCGAYSSNAQPCLTRAANGAQMKRQLFVHCDSTKKDDCSAYTAVSHYNKAVILVFRGTNGNMQLFLEAVESILLEKVPVIGGGHVSRYFYDAFHALWTGGVLDDLVQLRAENPTYELWITGHSLGGALASIAANVIVASGLYSGEQVKFISFGQPRTGDHEFGAAHDALLPYNYRVTHGEDIVPHVPTKNFEQYYHHRYEVWYKDSMDVGAPLVACLMPEDESCSNSNLFDLSTDDHRYYFNLNVPEYGKAGCV